MAFKVVWMPSAVGDLRDIVRYVAASDPSAAERLGQGILDHADLLGEFPSVGPTFPRGSTGPDREIVFGNYRIFYRVFNESKSVEIFAVWHGARGEPPSYSQTPH
jgi:plasmid stabilization system protein ParE